MKHIKTILIIISLGVAFVTCKKEEEIDPPIIDMHELGYDNLKTAYQGEAFHIDADIYADGKIDQIMLEIHKEGEHKGGGEWHVDSVYTINYQGLKNASFHEHLDVPATAETGSYHFHLAVNDQEGNQETYEDEITVIAQ